MRRFIPAMLIVATLPSCSLNKMFFQPAKIPQAVTEFKIGPDKAGKVVVIHFDGKKVKITDEQNKLVDIGYTIEQESIVSSDGNTINGWYVTPNQIAEPEIAILFLHGNAANIFNQFFAAVPLVKKGFPLFIIDYSGFGLSTGKPTAKNVRKDANTALLWLKQRPELRKSKLIIYGQSLGGHLSATIAKDNETIIDGLVTEGAFSSYRDIAVHNTHLGFIARVLVKNNYPAYKALKHFHKPVLIVHSTEDQTIPFDMGLKLFKYANEPKSFYPIKPAHRRPQILCRQYQLQNKSHGKIARSCY